MSLRKILEERKTLILKEPLIKKFRSSSSETKKGVATVLFYPPETVTTPKEFDEWLKRAVVSKVRLGFYPLPEYDVLSIEQKGKIVWER